MLSVDLCSVQSYDSIHHSRMLKLFRLSGNPSIETPSVTKVYHLMCDTPLVVITSALIS